MGEVNTENYSVLMSVYYREKPEYLRKAMDSMWNQTVPTNDFVLVCDGPLGQGLEDVISEMERQHPTDLHIIRLKENSGLGNALNVGLQYCKNELVARMDSDDISRPERCEKQLEVFRLKPEVSICSGIVEEFSTSIDRIDSCRVPPREHEEIVKYAKKRNAFNHPCVMFKKSEVENAGSYIELYLLEDYYLWIRMIQNNCIGYNLQQPLLWMRAGAELYKRRSGRKYAFSQRQLFKYMKNIGYISTIQMILSDIERGMMSILPSSCKSFIYKKILR